MEDTKKDALSNSYRVSSQEGVFRLLIRNWVIGLCHTLSILLVLGVSAELRGQQPPLENYTWCTLLPLRSEPTFVYGSGSDPGAQGPARGNVITL